MNILKKKIKPYILSFVTVAVMFFVFCFSGCVKTFSVKGSFTEPSVTLGVDDALDPSVMFESEKAVTFVSTDESVIVKEGEVFRALRSGNANVVASHEGLELDVLQVLVKQKYPSPSNLKVSNNGLVSWDEVSIRENGALIKPSYKLKITASGAEPTYASVATNSFRLTSAGSYRLAVQAVGNAVGVSSDYSPELSFSFDTLSQVENLNFLPSENFESQTGTLSWSGNSVQYELELGNLLQQPFSETSQQLDFSSFEEGQSLIVNLNALENGVRSKSQSLEIKKLTTPFLFFGNNELFWQLQPGDKHLVLNAKNLATLQSLNLIETSTTSILQGAGEGIYQIGYQIIASNNYANGNVKYFASPIAKISNVEASYTLNGSILTVNFSTSSEYNKKFVVKQNDQIFNLEFTGEKENGNYTLSKDFTLSQGKNVFSVQALPTPYNGLFRFGEQTATMALKSDEKVLFSAYDIESIKELKHSVDESGSVLTFNSLSDANMFEVKINDKPIALASDSITVGAEKTMIKLGKITSEAYGIDGSSDYVIELTATRSNQPDQITNPSIATKTLTMLPNPHMAEKNGTKLVESRYTWSDVSNAKYTYQLFTTGADFTTGSVEPEIYQTAQPQTKELKAGYYRLRVSCQPLDEDRYLASEGYSEDTFYYSETMNKTPLRLDYDPSIATSTEFSGYVLSMSAVEFAYEYQVYVNDVLQQKVFNENNLATLTFNFAKAIDFSDWLATYQIKVIAVAKDEASQTIHLNSTSVLNVSRLAPPVTYNVGENSTKLTVNNSDGYFHKAKVVLLKDGAQIYESAPGANGEANIDGYDGEFSIFAYAAGYDNFENTTTDGTTVLSSIYHEFKFHRSQTPTNLNYSNSVVSFDHSDVVEKYVVSITAISANGSVTRNFDVLTTSFNLEDEIASLRQTDQVFDSFFSQKIEIKISLFAHISAEQASVFMLPSRLATTKYDLTSTELSISKLDEVVLSYDDFTKKIFWSGVEGDGVRYQLYFKNGEEPAALQATLTDPIDATGRFEFDISTYDFSVAGDYKFFVVALSDNSLRSEPSGNIIFHKLTTVPKLRVYASGSDYKASFSLPNIELDNIEAILVNGTDIGSVPEFSIGSDTLSIVVKGKAFSLGGDKTFFISSDPSSFTIRQLQLQSYAPNLSIGANQISWSDFALSNANDWTLTTPSQNLKYELNIFDQAGQFVRRLSGISATSIALAHENLTSLAQGAYTFSLSAYVSEYEIASQGRGYYGSVVLSQNQPLRKLDSVSDLKAEIDLSQTGIDEELAKPILLTWTHSNVSTSPITFKVYINGVLVGETQNSNFSLQQSLFSQPSSEIEVVATSEKDICSNSAKVSVGKFITPQITISDQGLLAISVPELPPPSEGWIVELTAEGETTTIFTKSKQLDLQPHINARSGNYSVRVAFKSTSQISLPSQPAVFEGTILAKPTYVQDSTGLTFSSTDEGVRFEVRCPEMNFTQELSGNHFDLPDQFVSNSYTFIVMAKRQGSINSWTGAGAEFSITISRIATVSEVTFQRSQTYDDYTLSWQPIAQASTYEISIFKNSRKILTSSPITSPSILLSALESELGTRLEHGDYDFEVRTIADFGASSLTNSLPLRFAVKKVQNGITSIEASDLGLLTFSSSVISPATYIKATSLGNSEVQEILLSSSARQAKIQGLTGKISITITQLGTEEFVQSSNSLVSLDSSSSKAQLTKLQNISRVMADTATGRINILIQDESFDTPPLFYAKSVIGGNEHIAPLTVSTASNVDYFLLAIDLCELFPIENEGTFAFSIFQVRPGYLRSDESNFSIEFKFSNKPNRTTIVTEKGEDETEDFIFIQDPASLKTHLPITAIHVRTKNFQDWNYHEIDPTTAQGYWRTQDGINTFSKNQLSINDTACFAILVNDLLAANSAGTILVQVGYVTEENGNFTLNYWTEQLSYEKLSGPSHLQIDLGNLKWRNSEGPNTGFVLSFENDEGIDKKFITVAEATYYLGENITKKGEFYVAIQAVSTQKQILPSNKLYITSGSERTIVRKLEEVATNLELIDGVLQLGFDDQRTFPANETRPEDSIENMLVIRNTTDIYPNINFFVNNLLYNQLTYPFDFKLSALEQAKFNLKFVNINTKNTYYTTVNAANILKRLKQTTLDDINNILSNTALTNLSHRTALTKAYKLLTDENYFTGVATSQLLFDNIGKDENGLYGKYSAENIPAGTYDIYVQQPGSKNINTISSQYTKKLSEKEVIPSPQTIVSKEVNSAAKTNTYYLEFKPVNVSAESAEIFTSYTLSLAFNHNYEVINTEEKAERRSKKLFYDYDITYDPLTGTWSRTSNVGDAVPLTVKDGYVRIGLNDANGLIYEKKTVTLENGDAEVMLLGHDCEANIYVNGDSTRINSKTEAIQVVFLDFNIDSLNVSNGYFVWDSFQTNNFRYSTQVIYKNTLEAEPGSQVIYGGTKNMFTPQNAGTYEYITFFTPGSISRFTVNVDSATYTLNDFVKLRSPNLSPYNGKIMINDKNEYSTLIDTNLTTQSFIIGNDIIQNQVPQKIYPEAFEADKNNDGSFSLLYSTGLSERTPENEDNETLLHLSEQTAKRIDVSVSGDNVEKFEIGSSGTGKYTLTHTLGRKLMLQSSAANLRVNKLGFGGQTGESETAPSVQSGITVNNSGVVEWTPSSFGVAGLAIPDIYQIVYEVELRYYYETSSGGYTFDNRESTKFFTTSTTIDPKLYNDPPAGGGVVYFYQVLVRANAYLKGGSDITTVEGELFGITSGESAAKYSNDCYILDSELSFNLVSEGTLFEKTKTPTSFTVNDGELNWAGTTSQTVNIYAQEPGRDPQLFASIENSQINSLDVLYPGESGVLFALDPTKRYTFYITATKLGNEGDPPKNQLVSDPRELRDISVLPMIQATDYEVSKNGNDHTVDFKKYFETNTQAGTNNIKIKGMTGGTVFELTRSTSVITLINAPTTITARAFSAKANCLSATSQITIDLSLANWADADNIYFDQTTQNFEWTYGAVSKEKTIANAKPYLLSGAGYVPYGAEESEPLVDYLGDFYPILYKGAGSEEFVTAYVRKQFADLNADGTNPGKITVRNNGEAEVYYREGDGYVGIGVYLETEKQYDFALASVKIQKELFGMMRDVYLPINIVKSTTTAAGITLITTAASEVFTDAAMQSPITIGSGIELKFVEKYDKAKEYQLVDYQGTEVYLKTSDILHYISQSNVEETSVFRVTIQTRYEERINGTLYRNDITRTYDDIPLGERIFGNYQGESLGEEGIYLTRFEPNLVGEILSFNVQVRNSKNNLLSGENKYGETVKFNLFASGEGTSSKPFIIESVSNEGGMRSGEEMFANLSKRYEKKPYHNSYYEKAVITSFNAVTSQWVPYSTSQGAKTDEETLYSFKQNEDLSFRFDNFVITDEFVGNYDGNNFVIEVSPTSVADLDQPIVSTIAAGSSSLNLSFTKGAALFRSIAKQSTLKNIQLRFLSALDSKLKTSLQAGKAVISGLVLLNGGTIENISVSASEFAFNTSLAGGSYLAVAPVVGENKGRMTNISSTANVNIENTFSQASQNFLYGGLIGFNNTSNGKLSLATNDGSISVKFTKSQNGMVSASGIAISSTAYSTVEMAQNNGDITVNCTSGSACAAGVLTHASNASIYSSVNTGNIQGPASSVGGVIYSFANSAIGSLVGMGRVNGGFSNLIAKFGSVRASSICYSYGSYTSTLPVTPQIISASTTIVCQDANYQIVVDYTSVDSYAVTIEKR